MAKKSVNETVKTWISQGKLSCPVAPQGVSKTRIKEILLRLSRFTEDTQDVVFALLDESANWYSAAPAAAKFSDGACTAHIGAHVAILQRQTDAKLDREGRDNWIKPLRDIGAIELCYIPAKKDKALLEKGNKFYSGHPKAKSPNNAYRLTPSFVNILKQPDDAWEENLNQWIAKDKIRERLSFQAKLAKITQTLTDNSHTEVIKACCKYYAPKFLPEYEVIYVDDGDGDRITEEQRKKLQSAGLDIQLHDAMPDVLLWSKQNNMLWVIEAVTSDGEVDIHKISKMKDFAKRHKINGIGFTTAYPNWKKAAERQKKTNNNMEIDSYFWIVEDASKNFKIEG